MSSSSPPDSDASSWDVIGPCFSEMYRNKFISTAILAAIGVNGWVRS